MSVLLFCAAVVLLFAGHLAKVQRWRLFVQIYESTKTETLISALTYGYLVNYILPFHIGDLVRAFWAGRKMENGHAFSLATVIMDRCLDVWAVGLIFGVMYCTGVFQDNSSGTVVFYICLAVGLIALVTLSLKRNRTLKIMARKFCSIFNDRIELTLLVFLWSGITSVKNLLTRINKKQLLLRTAVMWGLYLLSYYTMSLALKEAGYDIGFLNILLLLFDSKQLSVSALQMSRSFSSVGTLMIGGYILSALLLLLCVSLLYRLAEAGNGKEASPLLPLRLLPQKRDKDKLRFLEEYFDANNSAYLKTYIQLNQDVTILEDYSAGSSATTMLCMKDGSLFYRKYVFGGDADKLRAQIRWLEEHRDDIPLPDVIKVQQADGYCCYDMPYHPAAIGMFQYMHSVDARECWELLKDVLEDLQRTVYKRNARAADPETVEQYIDEKVLANFAKIEAAHELSSLLQCETLIINEKEYIGYPALKRWMNKADLQRIFAHDVYSDIHGDLTVENIIRLKEEGGPGYYLIDPNTGNLHESPYLDYSKLLQSLHGGYEFLMRAGSVEVNKNTIRYLSVISQKYSEIFGYYQQYLRENYSQEQLHSIYCHEIVHWLRLMPYKIKKNGKLAAVFFAGMIIVFNDIMNWCERADYEKSIDDTGS